VDAVIADTASGKDALGRYAIEDKYLASGYSWISISARILSGEEYMYFPLNTDVVYSD